MPSFSETESPRPSIEAVADRYRSIDRRLDLGTPDGLETANIFARLLTVILIGLAVEGLVFRTVEVATVRRWGVQNG